jgi:hypothetical protein
MFKTLKEVTFTTLYYKLFGDQLSDDVNRTSPWRTNPIRRRLEAAKSTKIRSEARSWSRSSMIVDGDNSPNCIRRSFGNERNIHFGCVPERSQPVHRLWCVEHLDSDGTMHLHSTIERILNLRDKHANSKHYKSLGITSAKPFGSWLPWNAHHFAVRSLSWLCDFNLTRPQKPEVWKPSALLWDVEHQTVDGPKNETL